MFETQFFPGTGRGTTCRVVEGHPRMTRGSIGAIRRHAIGTCPSTMLRMVPLPVPERIS
jgi:hypothetical protein